MPGTQNEELCVFAPDEVRRRPGLEYGTDIGPATRDVQHRPFNVRQVHPLPTELQLARDELVLLVEVPYPLPESRSGERYAVFHPLAYGQTRSRRFAPRENAPRVRVGAEVTLERRACYALDESVCLVGRDVPGRPDQEVRIELPLPAPVGPEPEETRVVRREFRRRRQKDQVRGGAPGESAA